MCTCIKRVLKPMRSLRAKPSHYGLQLSSMRWTERVQFSWILCIVVSTKFCATQKGPSYNVACTSDGQCSAAGAACFKDYIGCDVGTCGCRYGTRQDGSCVHRLEEDGCSCTSDEHCGRGLECMDHQCKCAGRMVESGAYCLKQYELLVGARCGSGEICVHRKEGSDIFVSTDVECLNTVCQCRLGLVADGWTCRRYRPGEQGCSTSSDCSGDSICESDRRCACPAGHREVTSGKCGKIDARTNLGKGATCDEIIQKDKFCSPGLECVKCGEYSSYKCREYRQSRASSSTCSGEASLRHTPMTSLLSLIFIIMFYV